MLDLSPDDPATALTLRDGDNTGRYIRLSIVRGGINFSSGAHMSMTPDEFRRWLRGINSFAVANDLDRVPPTVPDHTPTERPHRQMGLRLAGGIADEWLRQKVSDYE